VYVASMSACAQSQTNIIGPAGGSGLTNQSKLHLVAPPEPLKRLSDRTAELDPAGGCWPCLRLLSTVDLSENSRRIRNPRRIGVVRCPVRAALFSSLSWRRGLTPSSGLRKAMTIANRNPLEYEIKPVRATDARSVRPKTKLIGTG